MHRQEVPHIARHFWSAWDELPIDCGLLLKGTRVCMPPQLLDGTFADLHGAHQGTAPGVTADYLTHKGREYLLICDLFNKYPFIHKVSTKSAQSLCASSLELISQYRPPSLLFMDSGLSFTFEELKQFLQHHCIDHATSCPHFPGSNGFIEQHIPTIKTTLSISQDSNISLEHFLLDLQLTPIGPKMPSP